MTLPAPAPCPAYRHHPVAVAFALLLSACATASPAFAQDSGWQLVWSDEFDGTDIDMTKWTHEVNAWGGGNNELQFYTARRENSFVEDGVLVIRAIRERYTAVDPRDGQVKTRDYTSARLNTRFKGDWLYGRFEVRAQVPGRQGLWPAIWMLPSDFAYGGWAASGEIDIMEHRGDQPTTLHTTIHYGGEWPRNTYHGATTNVPDLSAGFHTYALEWYENEMIWFFDGQEVWRTSAWWSENAPYPAPFDQRFHLLLNVAVGGSFLPDPPPDADYFPREMRVDYVRVYQRESDEQAPWAGEPATLPGRVQAELYDLGGSLVAYSDREPQNLGGAFRLEEGVDIEFSQDGDGYSIGWFAEGEWVEYTVSAASTGVYSVAMRYATAAEDARGRIEFRRNGEVATAFDFDLANTGGWYAWRTVALGNVPLEEGEYIVRVLAPHTPYNFNHLDFAASPGRECMWMVIGD